MSMPPAARDTAILCILEAFYMQVWGRNPSSTNRNRDGIVIDWEGFFLACDIFNKIRPERMRDHHTMQAMAGVSCRMASRFVTEPALWTIESCFHALGGWTPNHYHLDFVVLRDCLETPPPPRGLPFRTCYFLLMDKNPPRDIASTATFLLLLGTLYTPNDGQGAAVPAEWAEASLYMARRCHGHLDPDDGVPLHVVRHLLEALEYGPRPSMTRDLFPDLFSRSWETWAGLLDPDPDPDQVTTRKRKSREP